MKIPPETKPALWGAVGGAAALAIIGFTWGGWVGGGTADKMARERADRAVVAALTPVCVQRFQQASDASAQFAALKKIDRSYERSTYVEKGGWATPPGSDKANSDVAQACADALNKLAGN
jgi:hypothetical protein